MEHLANLPLVVAVGVADGIGRLPGIDPDAVRIKWPNDILLHGAKCVGILIESERLEGGRLAVGVGAGVNLDAPGATQAAYPIAALREHGFSGALDEAFEGLATGVEAALHRWDRGRGFAAVRAEWLARAKGIGEPVRVNLADRSVDGRFVELDGSGRLVLETSSGKREVFSAGDLFFSGVAAPVPV